MKSTMVAVVAAVLLVAFGGFAYFAGQRSKAETVSSLGPTVAAIRNLAELVTTKITVSDVLMADEEGYRGSWLVKGDVLLGIDLDSVEITEKNEVNHTATVLLPQPHVVMARVDHERTLTWDVKKVTWNPLEWDQSPIRDKAMQQAQRLVEHVGTSQAPNAAASRHAEQVIEKLYNMVGWTVEVHWRQIKKDDQ